MYNFSPSLKSLTEFVKLIFSLLNLEDRSISSIAKHARYFFLPEMKVRELFGKGGGTKVTNQ